MWTTPWEGAGEKKACRLYSWINISRRVSPIDIQVSCAAPCPGKAGALSLLEPTLLPTQFWKKKNKLGTPPNLFSHWFGTHLWFTSPCPSAAFSCESQSLFRFRSASKISRCLKWHFRHFPSAKVTLNTIVEELERATCRQARKSDSRANVVCSHLKSRHILFLTFQETACLLCPLFRVTWKSETLETGEKEKTDYYRPCCCPEQFFLFSI